MASRNIKGRGKSALALVFAAAALGCSLSPPAPAAEVPGRAEYVQRLEGICRPDSEATERAMRGVRDDVRAGRTAVAAGKFDKGARIFAGTIRRMGPVPRPTADLARLRRWFVYLGRQEAYLRQVTARLRAGSVIQAQRAIARFIHNGNLANNAVLAFGFDYCDFRFSRYG